MESLPHSTVGLKTENSFDSVLKGLKAMIIDEGKAVSLLSGETLKQEP